MTDPFHKEKKEDKNEVLIRKLGFLLKYGSYAIGVVLLVVMASQWMSNRGLESEQSAYSQLFQSQLIEAGKDEDSSFNKVLEWTEIDKSWSDAKKKEYSDSLARVISEHPKSTAAVIASFKLARYLEHKKNWDAAQKLYEGLVTSVNDPERLLFAAMAYESLGILQENRKQYDKAKETFAQAIALSGNPLMPLAYLGRARNAKQTGDVELAAQDYSSVIEKFPESKYAQQARVLKAMLDSGKSQ